MPSTPTSPRRATLLLLLLVLLVGGLPGPADAAPAPASPATYRDAVLADAPSRWYRLGDAAGSPMADAGPAGVAGTYATAKLTAGVPGAPLDDPDTAVRSSGGPVGSAAGTGLPTGNAARTLEVWFRGATARDTVLLGTGGTAAGGGFSLLLTAGGRLALDLGGERLTAPNAPPSDVFGDRWVHAVVVWNGSTAAFYVDAFFVGSVAHAPLATAAGPLRLGRAPVATTAPALVGALDEAAVYPAALGQPAVRAHTEAALHLYDLAVASVASSASELYAAADGSFPPFSWTARVTNRGRYAAHDVVATAAVPVGLEISTATRSGGSCSVAGQTVTCPLGSVAPGQVLDVVVGVRPLLPGRYPLDVTVGPTTRGASYDVLPADNRRIAGSTRATGPVDTRYVHPGGPPSSPGALQRVRLTRPGGSVRFVYLDPGRTYRLVDTSLTGPDATPLFSFDPRTAFGGDRSTPPGAGSWPLEDTGSGWLATLDVPVVAALQPDRSVRLTLSAAPLATPLRHEWQYRFAPDGGTYGRWTLPDATAATTAVVPAQPGPGTVQVRSLVRDVRTWRASWLSVASSVQVPAAPS